MRPFRIFIRYRLAGITRSPLILLRPGPYWTFASWKLPWSSERTRSFSWRLLAPVGPPPPGDNTGASVLRGFAVDQVHCEMSLHTSNSRNRAGPPYRGPYGPAFSRAIRT